MFTSCGLRVGREPGTSLASASSQSPDRKGPSRQLLILHSHCTHQATWLCPRKHDRSPASVRPCPPTGLRPALRPHLRDQARHSAPNLLEVSVSLSLEQMPLLRNLGNPLHFYVDPVVLDPGPTPLTHTGEPHTAAFNLLLVNTAVMGSKQKKIHSIQMRAPPLLILACAFALTKSTWALLSSGFL